MKRSIINQYHLSFKKRLLDVIVSIVSLIALIPVMLIFCNLIKKKNSSSVFFTQKRVGKDGEIFELLKFRTMRPGAERQLNNLIHLNEVDGPVFKIKDDPRFVGIGKFLARTGLDELPQLINVIKGEMSLVGPRPLPVYEAKNLTKGQKVREQVLPGMTSSWVISGAHSLSFAEWMKLDRIYVENASFMGDLLILIKTGEIVIKQILNQVMKKWS